MLMKIYLRKNGHIEIIMTISKAVVNLYNTINGKLKYSC